MLLAVSLLSSCVDRMEPTEVNPVVVIPDGAVVLQDTGFGIYYGDSNYDGTALYSIVLSDARCYQDDLDSPYMDSEGDMLVLRVHAAALASSAAVEIPTGEFPVEAGEKLNTVDPSTSYVVRMVGSTQSKWALKSGSVSVTKDGVVTRDFVIEKDGVADTVDYVCMSPVVISDYMEVAPGMVSLEDDIIDMPFHKVDCIYNGDLFGNGTGNFLVSMITKGLVTDEGEVTDAPGIYVTLNFFSRLYSGTSQPVLEEGRYEVATATSSTLFQRWTLLPGLLMDNTPFGTYVLQQPKEGEGTIEYVSSGFVNVEYEDSDEAGDKMCTLTYELRTSGRKITGIWKGVLRVDNQASTGSNESYLTTLDHDVECDMSKVKSGTLRHIETLHRENVKPEWDYDIAEAWQLYLQPRDWTETEKNIPWVNSEGYMYDENNNGIRDRLEAWCADGDVMVLEFILPLGSEGVIAPELNKTYTYTMQPNLALEAESYEIYVSKMGRPHDEVFDERYATDYPGWAEGMGITSYDRVNARRGFTWATDGFRGNWYLHYEEGQHFMLDGHAPAVNGWVKVTRTDENVYDFEWDFTDDNPGTHNKITGSIKGCLVNR